MKDILNIYNDVIYVDTKKYLEYQPVIYNDIEHHVEYLRSTKSIYKVIIDINDIDIYDVNIIGFIKLIWSLYIHTYHEYILSDITIKGVNPKLWRMISPCLPEFISDIVHITP